jgi:hypothetical protein
MAKAIAAQKPDLVLVGAQHARRFSKKYRSLDLVKTYEWDADDLKRYPNVSRVLSTQDEHKVKLLIHLWGRVLDTKSDPEQVPQLYEEASRREPDLVRLTLRAFSTLRPELMAKLVPHEDLAFLKMPVSEAQKRVVAAFGIDKWIG